MIRMIVLALLLAGCEVYDVEHGRWVLGTYGPVAVRQQWVPVASVEVPGA